ncbi:MAG TPA: serpin family protein [Chthoniobacteraceae bacterium]|jgi:serpin B
MKLIPALLLALSTVPLMAADSNPAVTAINQLGVDLHHALAKGDGNLCLSPYSIQTAMAMVYAGADGETRKEMAKTLHFPNDGKTLSEGLNTLAEDLDKAKNDSAERAKQSKNLGGPSEPIVFNLANRLFGEKGFAFEQPYLDELAKEYHAPLEQLDFTHDAEGARKHINGWVEEQTHQRIRDLIPSGALSATSRLVLANALYLKAPWEKEFYKGATKPAPFQVHGNTPADVPTMSLKYSYGYSKENGFVAVSLPYSGRGVQFLILLPDEPNGLKALEAKLTPALFAKCAKLTPTELVLFMPKFKLESASIALKPELEGMGMKTAFDNPKGSADFDKIAPRRPNDYLYISDVFHKTFIAVDEEGTEAAAATAVLMAAGAAMRPVKPMEVHVDHPFVFAIQEVQTGACLFLGRLTDPR